MAGNTNRTMTIRFAGDSAGLKRSIKDVVSGLDETESAGKRVATAIGMLADDAEVGMAQAAAASERLAAALGDETVAAINAAGRSVDGWIADLRRMGLTFSDIESEADALAASIKRAEQVARSGFKEMRAAADVADDGIVNLTRSGDQSRSVLANLAGNTAQDLGEIGGAAGTAGVAIGQLVEYAVDGNIALGNLAKVAGPMALVTAAGWGISAAFDAAAKRAEEAARKAGVLKDAINALNEGDTKSAALTLVEEYGVTLDLLEQMGFGAEDLRNTLEGQGYVIRSLSRDYRDLQERLSELRDLQASGNATTADLQELEATEDALKNVSDVLRTLRKDQGVWAEQEVEVAQFNRRVNELNTSLEAAGGYWGEIARRVAQARSVSNDLADQDKAATSAANKLRALRDEVEGYIAEMGNIPDEEITEIRAALDSGNIALVERLLANLTRNRITDVTIRFRPVVATTSKGAAAAGTGSRGTTTTYNPGAILKDMLNEATAAAVGGGGGGGRGGGGGGGGGPDVETPEEIAQRFEREVGNLFETGQFSLDAYRDFLRGRLALYATYSDEYKRIFDKLRELDRIEQGEKDKAAEAERKRAEEAKKAADEAAKAREAQLDALRQLLEVLTGFVTVQYGNLEGAGGNVTGAGAAGLMTASQLGGVIASLLESYQAGVS